jgi:hypothetical protein
MRIVRSLVHAAMAALLVGMMLPGRASAQTVWDLGALAGAGGSLGSSHTFTNGLLGSVTAYSSATGISIFSKDFGSPLTDDEHGLGVCSNTAGGGTSCSKDATDEEIGDYNPGWIILSLNLASGNGLAGFQLGSVQSDPNETWKVFYETAATCNASTSFAGASFYSGTGPNAGPAITTQSTVGNLANCYEFAEPSTIVGDYLLQSITTQPGGLKEDVVPEPASLSLLATGLFGLVAAGKRRRKPTS